MKFLLNNFLLIYSINFLLAKADESQPCKYKEELLDVLRNNEQIIPKKPNASAHVCTILECALENFYVGKRANAFMVKRVYVNGCNQFKRCDSKNIIDIRNTVEKKIRILLKNEEFCKKYISDFTTKRAVDEVALLKLFKTIKNHSALLLPQIIDAYQSKEYINIITNAPECDKILQSVRNVFVKSHQVSEEYEELIRYLAASLLTALEMVHNFGYLHGNIHPKNVWMMKSGTIQLSNFHRAIKSSFIVEDECEDIKNDKFILKPFELQNYRCNYTRATEYFMVGALLRYMFIENDMFNVKFPILSYRDDYFEFSLTNRKVSKAAADFLALLILNTERLKKDNWRSHPWFKGFDFASILNKTHSPWRKYTMNPSYCGESEDSNPFYPYEDFDEDDLESDENPNVYDNRYELDEDNYDENECPMKIVALVEEMAKKKVFVTTSAVPKTIVPVTNKVKQMEQKATTTRTKESTVNGKVWTTPPTTKTTMETTKIKLTSSSVDEETLKMEIEKFLLGEKEKEKEEKNEKTWKERLWKWLQGNWLIIAISLLALIFIIAAIFLVYKRTNLPHIIKAKKMYAPNNF